MDIAAVSINLSSVSTKLQVQTSVLKMAMDIAAQSSEIIFEEILKEKQDDHYYTSLAEWVEEADAKIYKDRLK